VTLTPAGAILRDRADNLLRAAESAEHLTRLAMNGKAGQLRIGFGITSLAAGLPDILTRFRQRFPEVQVSMRDMSTPDQVEALEADTIDVGFVRLPVDSPALVAVPVLEERLMAAIPSGMPCPEGLPGLRKESFIAISRGASASFFDHLVRTCRAAGFSPRIVQEVSELFTVLNLVRAGVGVSLVPRSVSLMRVPGVQLLDTALAEAEWRIGLAWRRLEPPNPLVRNFVSLARQLAVPDREHP
jgi:DNA-binding transcriptional LysR family regulator